MPGSAVGCVVRTLSEPAKVLGDVELFKVVPTTGSLAANTFRPGDRRILISRISDQVIAQVSECSTNSEEGLGNICYGLPGRYSDRNSASVADCLLSTNWLPERGERGPKCQPSCQISPRSSRATRIDMARPCAYSKSAGESAQFGRPHCACDAEFLGIRDQSQDALGSKNQRLCTVLLHPAITRGRTPPYTGRSIDAGRARPIAATRISVIGTIQCRRTK